ncbi:MAG: hypothetical protein O7F71_19135 [Gammaproteobacteria bacterium]|nr:hypothetical protein [Gammaproteobacteria bacterium]
MSHLRRCTSDGILTLLLLLPILLGINSANAGPGPGLRLQERITPTFGFFVTGLSGRQFILNTDSSITGADTADYLFGAVAGEIRIRKRGGAARGNIVAENISTTGGLSVAAVLCKFQNQPQTICNAPGINVTLRERRTLLLGLDVTTTQVHGGGDIASVQFDISVTLL